MFAIVNISGQQMKVEPGKFVYVNRLAQGEGTELVLDSVLLVENNGAVQVGQPFVNGATVQARVLEHLKDDKVIVFKKKKRKGYRVKRGHRQSLTKVQIESIVG
jgi:large subunit ribosomal protein L21